LISGQEPESPSAQIEIFNRNFNTPIRFALRKQQQQQPTAQTSIKLLAATPRFFFLLLVFLSTSFGIEKVWEDIVLSTRTRIRFRISLASGLHTQPTSSGCHLPHGSHMIYYNISCGRLPRHPPVPCPFFW